MKKPLYPLEQIALIKEKRLEEAEKILKEKKEKLDAETAKLSSLEKKLNETRQHRVEKIQKHLEEMEAGTTSEKITHHERYIKHVVDERLKAEQRDVEGQKKVVKLAEEAVEKARSERLKKHQEVEKMKLHKKEWEKEVQLQAEKEESLEADELGESIHVRKKRTKFWSSKDGKRK